MANAIAARGRLWSRAGLARAQEGDARARLVRPLILASVGVEEERRLIPTLAGQYYLSVTEAVREARAAAAAGIAGVLLLVAADRHDESALIATQRDWLVPRAVHAVKDVLPDLAVATDVCVCPYTTHGQCVLFSEGGADIARTHQRLGEIAVTHAGSGADLLLLSGMLPGSTAAVRAALAEAGHDDVGLAAVIRFESVLYAPYEAAVGIRPQGRAVPLLDPDDLAAALRRAQEEIDAGADLIVVEPVAVALDVLAALRARTAHPLAAFQVAGEYALASVSREEGWLDGPGYLVESARAARRAGADLIFGYGALQTAELLAAAETA